VTLQIATTFTKIDAVDAVIYQPESPDRRRRLALVTMHDNGDVLHNPAAARLAASGYTVIAANARTAPDPEDHATNWIDILADVATAVRYARGLDSTDRVVLYGHSSGAPLMAAYQNLAEHGATPGAASDLITPCPESLNGLPAADAVVLMDPIFGVGANVLASVDPAIVDEADPSRVDPTLDCFRPENGFSLNGATYSDEFRGRFFEAQARRNNRLIDTALERLRAIESGTGPWTDDAPFVVPGATRYPRLWRPDLGLLSHTRREHRLLRGDGSESTQVIRSVRPPSGTSPNSRLLSGGTLNTSVRRFLNTFATWGQSDYAVGEDFIRGVDWSSSITNTLANAPGVSVPTLIMAMTAHYWLVSAEMTYDQAGAADRSLAFVEGATHGFTPMSPVFGDTFNLTLDFVAGWLADRF
jgi:acetyl esterase/lipase